MRIGLVQIAGNEDVCDLLEKEFEKEISTLEVKRARIPTIDSSPLATRLLLEDGNCDIAVIPYRLKEDEKLGMDFNLAISFAEFWLKKQIFKVIIYPDEEVADIVKDAVNEIIQYYFRTEKPKEESGGTPSPFGFLG